MSHLGLTYAAITPARDEEQNLARLAACMTAQTVTPAQWVIVENGSRDGTLALARGLAAEHAWITVLRTEPGGAYDRTSPYMRAFHAGLERLGDAADLVVKLDADVSMEPGYFEGVLAEFAGDPTLGIASGTLLEKRDGEWREIVLLADHCWGPTRTYRRACLEAVLPLDDGVNYASVDETQAHLAGFRTATLRHLPFHHHRPEGVREGAAWRNWFHMGVAAHHMGYRPSYLLARCAFRMLRDRAAPALLAGYLSAALQGRPQHADVRVIATLRDNQRARRFFRAVH